VITTPNFFSIDRGETSAALVTSKSDNLSIREFKAALWTE
jgi:hypothetical protein